MGTKQEALIEISNLVKEHNIRLHEIADIFEGVSAQKADQQSIATKLFSYLGGIFILSGIMAFVMMFWDDMNSAGRIIITLGVGFSLYLYALIKERKEPNDRSITPLLLISAALQPTGLFVAIEEFSTGGDWHLACVFVFGLMLIQQLCTFISNKRGVLLFTSMCFGSALLATMLDWINLDEEFSCMIVGFSLLCISYSISNTPYRAMSGFWYFIGAVALLSGLFGIVEGTPLELVYLAVSCFLIYVSTVAHSRSLLTVSTFSLLFYIGYFTAEHFVDSVGWPIALILLGFAFFGISSGVMKIKNKYMKD